MWFHVLFIIFKALICSLSIIMIFSYIKCIFRFSPVHNMTLFFRWQRNSPNYGKLNKMPSEWIAKWSKVLIFCTLVWNLNWHSRNLWETKTRSSTLTLVHGCRCRILLICCYRSTCYKSCYGARYSDDYLYDLAQLPGEEIYSSSGFLSLQLPILGSYG